MYMYIFFFYAHTCCDLYCAFMFHEYSFSLSQFACCTCMHACAFLFLRFPAWSYSFFPGLFRHGLYEHSFRHCLDQAHHHHFHAFPFPFISSVLSFLSFLSFYTTHISFPSLLFLHSFHSFSFSLHASKHGGIDIYFQEAHCKPCIYFLVL